jgi:hypothetical protein
MLEFMKYGGKRKKEKNNIQDTAIVLKYESNCNKISQ